ncbi:hypothetical protein [Blastopirellula retiformator]|uniref:Uncharacterized protein n=1 Tax=Blastopirellula retiformator TaxID=2527970 RepID=A0A5C5UWD3_9BACT|nr:hypothetical protein [Blastopirellula retiformator]TWT30676.1 hypothetical protein Enr8_41980 [Blastopirellula retiformator]
MYSSQVFAAKEFCMVKKSSEKQQPKKRKPNERWPFTSADVRRWSKNLRKLSVALDEIAKDMDRADIDVVLGIVASLESKPKELKNTISKHIRDVVKDAGEERAVHLARNIDLELEFAPSDFGEIHES